MNEMATFAWVRSRSVLNKLTPPSEKLHKEHIETSVNREFANNIESDKTNRFLKALKDGGIWLS